jgi:Leucine-rich repeat (LRR) protein
LLRPPPPQGYLSALRVLRLANNALTVLPADLGGCRALEEVDVSYNKLTELPPCVGECVFSPVWC